MNRWHKIENIAGAVIFGSLGISSLVAALFFGHTHQYFIAGIALVVSAAFLVEIVQEERKAKTYHRRKSS